MQMLLLRIVYVSQLELELVMTSTPYCYPN